MNLPKLPLFILLLLLGLTLAVYTYKLNYFKYQNKSINDFNTSADCNIGDDDKKITINFKECEPCQKTVAGAFGSTKFTMYPVSATDNNSRNITKYCILNYGVATENPLIEENLTTTCVIPMNHTDNSFSKADFGINFAKISKLCESNAPEESSESKQQE